MKEIRTEINIKSPKAKVWDVFADVSRYSEWNPFIRSFKGELLAGRRIRVSLALPDSKEMVFKPRLQVVDQEKEVRWLGRLLIPGLFDGVHIFEFQSMKDGSTNFVQREYLKGVLLPLLWRSLEGKTNKAFIAMNEALKRRCER